MDGLIYVYGLVPATEAANQPLPPLQGFDGKGGLYAIPMQEVTAIACDLEPGTYTEENIEDRIQNDVDWLQEKAFHHHETVMQLSRLYTMVPMKFCTLYKNEHNLQTAVQESETKITRAFSIITGNEEWNLKIYCDDEQLKEKVSQSHPEIEAKRAEISELPKGRQFFEKKKLDKLVDAKLEEEKNKISESIHHDLSDFAMQGNVKRNWSSDVTGRKDQMTWNSVYLISGSETERFLERVQQYEQDMKETGWEFVASGPWPAYHFSSFS